MRANLLCLAFCRTKIDTFSGELKMSNIKVTSSAPMDRIRELLSQDRLDDTLDYLDHIGQTTPEFQNARAVCLMRLGKAELAVSILRKLVFREFICIPSDTPVLYLMNFATAMLVANYKDGAIPILKKLDTRRYPQAAQLKMALNRWVKGLNFAEKCYYHLGIYPGKPVRLDFPLGQIDLMEADERNRKSA